MSKERVLVVCPGRGTYNKAELGYLRRYHADRAPLVLDIDALRQARGQESILALDGLEKYSTPRHTAGENASALIYACAHHDFNQINTDKYDVVAITGNSMGWYIALVCAGALEPLGGAEVINTMGSMMTDGLIGGQIIYPIVDERWHPDPLKLALVDQLLSKAEASPDIELHISIKLGGFIVLGGNQEGLRLATGMLPQEQLRYPMKLYNHAAFHTPMLKDTSARAFTELPAHLFGAPHTPIIDGRGHIWQPLSSDPAALYHYTLAAQVYDYYNFTSAVQVSVKEFAPDRVVILGPGNTLGGAVAQSLIQMRWRGLVDKESFIERQKVDPLIMAMGMPEQRALVT